MSSSYIDYAMSVIIARALPDVRDGLKPSQRRILVAMNDLNLAPRAATASAPRSPATPAATTTRTARPSVYPTLVRMAQDVEHALHRWSTARATSAPSTATRRRPCGTPRPASAARRRDARGPRPRHGRLACPTTTRRASEPTRAAGRSSPTCWSTARRASPSAWPPTSRRTTSARSATPSCTSSTTRRRPSRT